MRLITSALALFIASCLRIPSTSDINAGGWAGSETGVSLIVSEKDKAENANWLYGYYGKKFLGVTYCVGHLADCEESAASTYDVPANQIYVVDEGDDIKEVNESGEVNKNSKPAFKSSLRMLMKDGLFISVLVKDEDKKLICSEFKIEKQTAGFAAVATIKAKENKRENINDDRVFEVDVSDDKKKEDNKPENSRPTGSRPGQGQRPPGQPPIRLPGSNTQTSTQDPLVPNPKNITLDKFEFDLIKLTNEYRKTLRLPAYAVSATLMNNTRKWAIEAASRNLAAVAVERRDGNILHSRQNVFENACCYPANSILSPLGAFTTWKKSPEHDKNMRLPFGGPFTESARFIGVGRALDSNGKTYWYQQFSSTLQ